MVSSTVEVAEIHRSHFTGRIEDSGLLNRKRMETRAGVVQPSPPI
jgi:hypothetical protein